MTEPTKKCTWCGLVKPVSAFPWENRPDRTPGPIAACRECKNADQRQRRAANRAHARAMNRKHYAKYVSDPVKRERRRKSNRESSARARQDPVRRQRMNEDERIRRRLSAEREGRPIKSYRLRGVKGEGKGNAGLLLDPAPLIDFVNSRGGVAKVARDDETLQRALRRVMSGKSRSVALSIVDRVAVANDLLLHDLYDPNNYPEVFAA